MKEFYFDSAATTKPARTVIDAMVHTMEVEYGNPSSLHRKGLRAEQILDDARRGIARELDAREEEILFTSGGTEANTLAIVGSLKEGMRVLTTPVEHKSVLKALESVQDITLEYFDVDAGGRVDMQSVEKLLETPVDFVSVQQMNNETGAIQPIEEIGTLLKKKHPKAIFHVDGIQGFCKFESPVQKAQVDLYSMSGHKIYGPKGIGALFVRKKTPLQPMQSGGGQERGLRGGTQNVPGIAGMGAAVDLWQKNRTAWAEHAYALKNKVIETVNRWEDVQIITQEPSSPYILMLGMKDCKAEVMLHSLEQRGISISTGSACSKGAMSHVLEATKIPQEYASGALRISFSHEVDADDTQVLLQAMQENMDMIRKITKGRK